MFKPKTNTIGQILSVSQLNQRARNALESQLPPLWVSGEISNLMRASSGHVYFTLKDESAQIRVALFKSQALRVPFKYNNGLQVLVNGQVSLYSPRGDYQFIANRLTPVGDGLLRQQYETLKKQLQSEGLFDEAHKKPLPQYPKSIGVITSEIGAALTDVCATLKTRYPLVNLLLYPSAVQGERAHIELINALNQAIAHNQADVLILTRGGGSLEDLWPFNHRDLAYAIYDCPIPIISAVGHEVDFSLSDYVADQRAPTPTAAAQMATPEASGLLSTLNKEKQRLTQAIKWHLKKTQLRLDKSAANLRSPKQRLLEKSQKIDQIQQQITKDIHSCIFRKKVEISSLQQRLKSQAPGRLIEKKSWQINTQTQALTTALWQTLERHKERFARACGQLHAVSPLAIIDRGYGMGKKSDGQLISSIYDVKRDEQFDLHLQDGHLTCQVLKQIKSQRRKKS